MIIVYLIGQSKIEIVCHEVEYIETSKGLKKFIRFPLEKLEKIRWYLTPKIFFHTQQELNRFVQYYSYNLNNNFQLIQHNYYFTKKYTGNQSEARKYLSIEKDIVCFLCIGFISPHKGFQRAIHAFLKTESLKFRLFIVGHVQEQNIESSLYLDYLKNEASGDNRIRILPQYVEDEVFDMWLVASDYVVLPYYQAWSSGVIERVKLYQKTALVSRSGGLPEQADKNSIIFRDDNELYEMIMSLCLKN
jgi:glycosyltransferase involved in cell wall biosynthesis